MEDNRGERGRSVGKRIIKKRTVKTESFIASIIK